MILNVTSSRRSSEVSPSDTATGGYSDAQKEEILAILTKKEYGQFMDYVQAKDPNAFVTISNVKRVVGSWNTPKRRTYFEHLKKPSVSGSFFKCMTSKKQICSGNMSCYLQTCFS